MRPRRLTAWTAVGGLLLFGACRGVADLLSPGRPAADAPARLALAMRLPATAMPAEGRALAIDVLAAYERSGGQVVLLDSTRVTLSAQPTQQVALTLDLAPCLGDPRHQRDPTGGASCSVRLVLALMRDSVVLDAADVGPFRVAVGSRTVVPEVIPLFEVSYTLLRLAADSTPLPAVADLVVDELLPLQAQAMDVEGLRVTGRTVLWTSSNPAVASVSPEGLVTARAPGQARITAIVGGRAASITLIVVPAP